MLGRSKKGLLDLLLSAAQGEYGNIVNYGNTMLQLPLMALGAARGQLHRLGLARRRRVKFLVCLIISHLLQAVSRE